MATVDEILTRQAYAAGEETWSKDNNYPSYTLYVEPEYVPVTNKRIDDFNDQISVRGEQNARFVGFQLPRYDDGIDLTAQHLYIHYQTVYGGGDSVPCNVSKSDNYVRICWQVPVQATQAPGAIQMMIYVTGTNSSGEHMAWKTLPASYTIHDGLDIGGGIPEPDTSWYEQFVQQMESQVATAKGYADGAQASKTAASGSATASAQSAAISVKALEDNKAYVESQKETFVGYNRRETDLKYANALIGSASGTGRVSVGDAWEAPVADMEVMGRSEQGIDPSPEYPQPIISTGTVSTGAQLLDASKILSKTYKGIAFQNNGDGSFTIDGTATDYTNTYTQITLVPGTYVVSAKYVGTDSSPYQKLFRIRRNENESFLDYGLGEKFVVDDNNNVTYAAMFQVNIGETLNKFTLYPMLNAGATPKPWEPYTGGKPSPSPEYPQPLDVTVTGENLIDFDDWKKCPVQQGTGAWENGKVTLVAGNTGDCFTNYRADKGYISKIYVEPNTTYTLSWECEGDNGDVYIFRNGLVENNGHVSNSNKKLTFITNEDTEYITFRVGVREAGETASYWNLMLNKGANPQPWQPYQSRTAAITLTEPLRGIGDVRDRIMCRDGVWGVERQFVSVTLDGSENWGKVSTNNTDRFRFRTSKNKSIIKAEKEANIPIKILCDGLKSGSSSNTYSRIECISSSTSSDIYIYMGQFDNGNVDAFKAYLSAHPFNAMFERAIPTWEPLPSATQSALNALATYTGTTHVAITAGGPEPDVGLGYVQDIRAVVADLQAQIDAIKTTRQQLRYRNL